MRKKTRRGVVCLWLAAAMFIAAPLNRRTSADSSSQHLTRADDNQNDAGIELKGNKSENCSDSPDYAKGVTTTPSIEIPNFEDHETKPSFDETRKKEVLSLIHYPWEKLGFDVVFMKSRAGYRAMTLTAKRRIEVYVRAGEEPLNQAYDLAHELGHAFDLMNNNEAKRLKWRKLRGISKSTPWFGCDACPDYGTPAGDFAETFAYLLLGPGNYHSLMAPTPKLEQINELAEFCEIREVSSAFNLKKKETIQEVKYAKTDSHKEKADVLLSNEGKSTNETQDVNKPADLQTLPAAKSLALPILLDTLEK